jgi:hypothetical protein
LKEKLLRKKRERIQEKQQEEVKVELDNYSDDEYDTQKRFKVILYHTFLRLLHVSSSKSVLKDKQIKHTATNQRPMGRRSRTPEAPVIRRGVTPPRRKREKSPKNERRRSPSPYDPYYGKEAELKKKKVSRSPSPVRNFELAGNGKKIHVFLIS